MESVQKIVTDTAIEIANEWWEQISTPRKREIAGTKGFNLWWKNLSDTQKFQTWWYNA